MRVAQRQTFDHSAIIRALADKTIEAREPGLINLPLPLPSVPVLSPLLSPLVSGNNNNGNNGQGNGNGNGNGNNGNHNGNPGTTTTTTTPPSSTPSSGDTGGSSGSSSGGSTSGGSSSGGGTGDGSSSGSGSGASGSGSSSGSTTSSGDGSSSGGASSPSGGSSGDSSSSGTTPSGTNSTTGSQVSSTSGGSVLTGTNNNGTNSSSPSGAGGSSTPPGSQGNSGVGGVANAGQTPSTGGSGTTGSITGSSNSMGASGLPGSSTTGGSVSGGGALSNGENGGKHGLSGGATAGIIICLLALLFGCLIFFLRRRTRSRRNERVNRWWFSRNRFSQTYGDRNSREIIPTGVQTARSSFATTVDHTYSNHSGPPSTRDSQFIIPPLPPMAQIGRGNGAAPSLVIETSIFNSTNAKAVNDNRFSIGSANSESQYLVVNHRDSLNTDLGTPMSVRPFSPSESFAFPKPPEPASSRPSSSGTFGMQSPTKSLPASMVMPTPPTPALPSLIFNNNPINNVTDPFQDNNPFADPASASPPSNASVTGFAETEFICRPFHPTLPDELSVRPQDPVRVLQTFDDGWALVEKVRVDDPKGKRKESNGVEKGLIPLDCLRAPGQDLPDFFAAKRVSSYAGSVAGSGVEFQVL